MHKALQALRAENSLLAREKFQDPHRTAAGDVRAQVALSELQTLWINTGTLCNLACENCYIESSPKNDRLVYISAAEVAAYLDEIEALDWTVREIGFTGGEPFMNSDMLAMLDDALSRGFQVLVLTNAMRPMQRHYEDLLKLQATHGDRLTLRVSMDHYAAPLHEMERGKGSYAPMLEGLRWLGRHGFNLSVAGRTVWKESEAQLRDGYGRFFDHHDIAIDAQNPATLVLFPEMDETLDVPEITTACWDILSVDPNTMMCATSRMVVKHKGDALPTVMPCTLLPYDRQFDMGHTLAAASSAVPLNHPHCARFCVLGGASCSAG